MRKLIWFGIFFTIIFLPIRTLNLLGLVNKQLYIQVHKTDWDYLTESIIQVESEGKDNAINSKNHQYVGCLQISPIFVREANRLSENKVYFLRDRFDRIKSLEMFNIVQDYYNPEKNLSKAIKIHNPTASKNYGKKIMVKFNELKMSIDSLVVKVIIYKMRMGGRIGRYVPP